MVRLNFILILSAFSLIACREYPDELAAFGHSSRQGVSSRLDDSA